MQSAQLSMRTAHSHTGISRSQNLPVIEYRLKLIKLYGIHSKAHSPISGYSSGMSRSPGYVQKAGTLILRFCAIPIKVSDSRNYINHLHFMSTSLTCHNRDIMKLSAF